MTFVISVPGLGPLAGRDVRAGFRVVDRGGLVRLLGTTSPYYSQLPDHDGVRLDVVGAWRHGRLYDSAPAVATLTDGSHLRGRLTRPPAA